MWYSLDSMVRQMQWAGNELVDTGLLVGPDQVDVPQQQYRSPILPADPYPRLNPRVSPEITPALGTTPSNQGFTVFTLGFAPFIPSAVAPPAPPIPPPTPPTTQPSLDFSKASNSQYIWMM